MVGDLSFLICICLYMSNNLLTRWNVTDWGLCCCSLASPGFTCQWVTPSKDFTAGPFLWGRGVLCWLAFLSDFLTVLPNIPQTAWLGKTLHPSFPSFSLGEDLHYCLKIFWALPGSLSIYIQLFTQIKSFHVLCHLDICFLKDLDEHKIDIPSSTITVEWHHSKLLMCSHFCWEIWPLGVGLPDLSAQIQNDIHTKVIPQYS